jgi:hypothetical protein
VAETSFDVVYDGPALTDGSMLVRDLAPALLALGDLVAEASVTVYPGRTPAALSIKATEEGSFLVRLILEAKDQLVDFFSGDPVTALINLQELLFGTVSISLLGLIKQIRGRKVVRQEPEVESGHVRLTLADGTVIEGVPAAVLELYRNLEVQRHAREVVAPLRREGVEVIQFRIEQQVTVEITAAEVESFEPPAIEPVALTDETTTLVVSIASVAFVEGNKWRLDDGSQTFWAVMDDAEFLDRVEHGESFRKGDMLRCRIRVIQSHGVDGLHTERQVKKVIEHIPRELQLRLEDGEPGP